MDTGYFKNAFFFVLFLLLFKGCAAKPPDVDSGSLIYRVSFYNPGKKEYENLQNYYPDCNVWYRDSVVIERIQGLHLGIKHVVKGKVVDGGENSVVLEGYLFINIPTRSFYEYKTFTDTARLIKKYTQSDFIRIVSGWDFYAPRHLLSRSDPQVVMKDTSINNILYKRLLLTHTLDSHSGGKTKVKYIAYFRCDKKGSMFDIDSELGKKMGYPLTRIDELSSPGYARSMQLEILFLTNKLTPEENKVFDAWEKNSREDPVKK